MSETKETMRRHAFDCGIAPDAELAFIHDADRLAKLEDGIQELVNEIEPNDSVPHWVFCKIEALLDGENNG